MGPLPVEARTRGGADSGMRPEEVSRASRRVETDRGGRSLGAEAPGRAAGIALCGPNCMGVVSPSARSLVYIQPVLDASALAGNVGLISQSGSVCTGLLADCRRFG